MTELQTTEALLQENRHLHARLEELEETLHAIRSGEVDALVISGPEGEQVYTLKGALEPYRIMVENMSEGAVTLALDGTISYCNERFAELVKTPHERIVGLPLNGWVAEVDSDRFATMLAQGWNGIMRGELLLKPSDRTRLPVHLSMCPLPESVGKGIAVVITDLTEVVSSAEAWSRLALIVSSSDDAIISTSLDGTVESWNPAAERMFGYTAEEAIGQSIQLLIAPPDRSGEITQKLDTIRQGKRTTHLETVRMRKDGTRLDISSSASPIADLTGRILGMSLIMRDISERKRTEETLHESEEKFRYVFDHSPVGKSITSPSGEIRVNKAFCDMLGYTEQELKSHRWQDITHPDDIEPTQRFLDPILAGKQDSARFTKRYLHKNGGVIWAEVSTFLRRGRAGQESRCISSPMSWTSPSANERKKICTQHRCMHAA
ncbi:MAG TPA: PAS domain S-box protein [Gallionella sp.]|nr:PAS domain S-box protein [Gallionella sp.]